MHKDKMTLQPNIQVV